MFMFSLQRGTSVGLSGAVSIAEAQPHCPTSAVLVRPPVPTWLQDTCSALSLLTAPTGFTTLFILVTSRSISIKCNYKCSKSSWRASGSENCPLLNHTGPYQCLSEHPGGGGLDVHLPHLTRGLPAKREQDKLPCTGPAAQRPSIGISRPPPNSQPHARRSLPLTPWEPQQPLLSARPSRTALTSYLLSHQPTGAPQ